MYDQRNGYLVSEMLIETLSEIRLMKILYGEEAEHVVKNRQNFLLDLYLNLPGENSIYVKQTSQHSCRE